MTIPNYEAWKWRELWEVVEYREGTIYRTRKTKWHVPSGWEAEDGYTTAPFSTKELRQSKITINPHPEFK